MKQIEKLKNAVTSPQKYGIRKNTRVYRGMKDLLICGRATTGYSDRNNKYVFTWDLAEVLRRLGISHVYGNNAPRGGACGEFAALKGQVRKDVMTK